MFTQPLHSLMKTYLDLICQPLYLISKQHDVIHWLLLTTCIDTNRLYFTRWIKPGTTKLQLFIYQINSKFLHYYAKTHSLQFWNNVYYLESDLIRIASSDVSGFRMARIQLNLNVCFWKCQPERTVPPVAQPGQWPGHEAGKSPGFLCPEFAQESPSQKLGRWRKTHWLSPPANIPQYG